MSYDILYDKQFIKLEKTGTFIPMTIAGSSNCYEAGRDGRYNKRERSWGTGGSLFLPNGKVHGTEQEMLNHVKSIRDSYANRENEDGYDDSRLGYYMCISSGGSFNKFSYGKYKGWVTTGCRKALTLDQLAKHGHYLRIYVYAYKSEELKAATGQESINYSAQNEEMFWHWLEKAQKLVEGTNYQVSLTFAYMEEEDCRLFRKFYFPTESKTPKNPDDGYAVKMVGYGFIKKLTARSVLYSWSGDIPKVYATYKQAEQMTKRFMRKFGINTYSLEIHKVKNRESVETVWVNY